MTSARWSGTFGGWKYRKGMRSNTASCPGKRDIGCLVTNSIMQDGAGIEGIESVFMDFHNINVS